MQSHPFIEVVAMSRAPFDVHGSSAIRAVDPSPRTAKALRRGERSGSGVYPATDRPAPVQSEESSAPRTVASIRSEKAASEYRATREQRRSVQARTSTAQALDDALHARQVRGDDAYSNCAFARACDVDEKIVRDWRSGARPMPAWALKLMPTEIQRELCADVEAARVGKIERRELPNVRPLLSKLESQLANEDPAVALRELVAAARMLEGMIRRLGGG